MELSELTYTMVEKYGTLAVPLLKPTVPQIASPGRMPSKNPSVK
jgi:hypothetical protein